MGDAIVARDLGRVFVRRTRAGRIRRSRVEVAAVAGIDFAVAHGELLGYLGPNGAGKSTTIKMLTGILTPTTGEARVAGLDPHHERRSLAMRIGVVFGQRSMLWWDLPLGDSFDLLRHVYRVPPQRHRAHLHDLVDRLDMGALLQTPVRQLSLGQRMRGELAAALLHDPEVLFLDEPTIGLDVVSKHAVREALASLNRERGVTIVLTTHDLGDIERLCRRVIIIDQGTLIHDGTMSEILDRYGAFRTLVVTLADERPPLAVPGTTTVRVEGPRQWLRFSPTSHTAAAVLEAAAQQADILDLAIEEPDVEEVVRRVYEQG